MRWLLLRPRLVHAVVAVAALGGCGRGGWFVASVDRFYVGPQKLIENDHQLIIRRFFSETSECVRVLANPSRRIQIHLDASELVLTGPSNSEITKLSKLAKILITTLTSLERSCMKSEVSGVTTM